MSHQNCILNLLNLKDPNIIFSSTFCTDESINGIISKVFHATLSYTPIACHHCGTAMDSNIIKHGFKLSSIKLPAISGFNTFIKLKKQRYFCRHCNSTFSLSSNIVKKNCFISNNTKLSIALKAKDKISEKDIAKNHNVSHSTVNRIIDSFYHHHKPKYNHLPSHLCFDEFKSVKAASGAMSFIFCDSKTHQIIDIVEDRRLHVLKAYFLRCSKQARYSVKTIVIDMYSPYLSLIKAVFPRAKVIIDKFHLVQLFSRALNKTRISIMNSNKKHYYLLKRYWKLLLKDTADLNYVDYKYHRSFKNLVREVDIIDKILALNPVLKASYELYHRARHYIKNGLFHDFYNMVMKKDSLISDYMKTSIRTAKKYLPYIENTLYYKFTNGVIEGINNKIKVIKRIAFGYRSFFHFKNRILISQNLLNLKSA